MVAVVVMQMRQVRIIEVPVAAVAAAVQDFLLDLGEMGELMGPMEILVAQLILLIMVMVAMAVTMIMKHLVVLEVVVQTRRHQQHRVETVVMEKVKENQKEEQKAIMVRE